ncbi:baseplate J/gp47 family protein [Clostridium botulinum D/C]|uniref:baseplate J/gp47 family protein n=2 Tax=Clostridium botulinum TaxID=1491 RepID=UPI001E497A05|nr:baseplate J/gp47 family protein [Clostridium botulinum]MCD3234260.1 baseplate J/gp47 family protein [Clostridium botulinum D/C]MCD3240318.1 baseplate J/gp47 family protein [Clostridium botulinum D/C]MCD3267679.1 baseplate J/gp47 family protein [Clostridium botulinum D/C]MCD3306150.1 baseplate J/gp47 family protein [Clostridium botulinum D/C]MCD3314860.1 baseplate J/gp47 family protein [Clostridium botulinum D/C]
MYSEDSKYILDRMLSYIESDVSKCEGTLIYDALAPSSFEFEEAYENLDELLIKVFPQFAYKNGYSKELEEKLNEFGVFRKQGKYATGFVTVEGIKDTEVTKGTLVQTPLNLQYKTMEDAKINDSGTIDIKIQAVEKGTKFNVATNTITQLPVQLIGISKIYNKNNLETGRDIETDEDLYKRFLIKVQTPSTSGNIFDYINWSLEVDGVGNAIVKPLWNGNGTVKVILISSSGKCPSSEIIKNVTTNIEKKRPIGANVTIVGVKEKELSISYKLIHEGDLKEINKKVIENIQLYLNKIALKSNIVRFNRIANCILSVDNVIDYADLKLNNAAKDIELEDDTIAVLKEVVDSES